MSNPYNFTLDSTLQTLTTVSTFSSIYRTFDRPNIKFFDNSGIYNPSNNNINIFTNDKDAILVNENQSITFTNSLNVSGITIINSPSTLNNSLYISGTTIINSPSTLNSSLYISG